MSIRLAAGVGPFWTDNPESTKPKQLKEVSFAQILAKAQNPRPVDKQDAMWCIPSTKKTRDKAALIECGGFYCLVLDIDENPPELKALAAIILACCGGAGFLAYTTKSATEICQKSRVIIPTTKLNWYRWRLAQLALNDELTKAGITPDTAMLNANQLFYLPNPGLFYAYFHNEGPAFDPIKTPAFYKNMLALHNRIEAEKLAQTKARSARPPRAINRKGSIIAEFNSAYSVEELLIKSEYTQKGSLFRHPASQSGNFSASVKDGKVFTLSSTDPLFSKFAHDAFNVFVILFHDGNIRTAMLDAGTNWLNVEGVPWNKYQQRAYMGGG